MAGPIVTPEAASIVVACVVAIPPTIAAAAAAFQARKANKAVNGRPKEAPTISDDVAALRVDVARLTDRFDRHLEGHARPPRRGW